MKLTERCQHATPHLFCVKEVTRQQGNTATTAETSFFLACLCAVKVAELWDRLTWFAWTVFCLFLKDDVVDADPGRSRGFEDKATFYNPVRPGI